MVELVHQISTDNAAINSIYCLHSTKERDGARWLGMYRSCRKGELAVWINDSVGIVCTKNTGLADSLPSI